MITLYTWTTPNGRKASIMLEEIGLPYEVKPVNIGRDEQFDPAFLKISPNNKIPAIVDHDAAGGPLAIFESAAVLTYLAESSGQLLAASGAARWKALEWLAWQVGGLGPMLGQLNFFAKRSPEMAPLAIQRFTEESKRLLAVMAGRLDEVPYLAGDAYSIADIACYAWTKVAIEGLADVLDDPASRHPALARWLAQVGARPAVQRGMAIPKI
jgi:GSH-dependent disulfide-bond oxidoreductase